jgi:hypothetical protein
MGFRPKGVVFVDSKILELVAQVKRDKALPSKLNPSSNFESFDLRI